MEVDRYGQENNSAYQDSGLNLKHFKKLVLDYIRIMNSEGRRNMKSTFEEIYLFLENYEEPFFTKSPVKIEDIKFRDKIYPIEEHIRKKDKNWSAFCNNILSFDLIHCLSISNLSNSNTIYTSIFYAYILKNVTSSSNFKENLNMLGHDLEDLINYLHSSELMTNELREILSYLLTELPSFENCIGLLKFLESKESLTYSSTLVKVLLFEEIKQKIKNDYENGVTTDDKEIFYILLSLIDDKIKISFNLLDKIISIYNQCFVVKQSILFINPYLNATNDNIIKVNNETLSSEDKLFLYIENLNEVKILITEDEYFNLDIGSKGRKKVVKNSSKNMSKNEEKKEVYEVARGMENFEYNLNDEFIYMTNNFITRAKLVQNEFMLNKEIDFFINDVKEQIRKTIYSNNSFSEYESHDDDDDDKINFSLFFEAKIKKDFRNNLQQIILNKKNPENANSVNISQPDQIYYTNCCYKKIQFDSALLPSNGHNLLSCGHLFCINCIRRYIISSTNNNIILTYFDKGSYERVIKCIKPACKHFISKIDIVTIFNESFDRVILPNYLNRCESIREKIDDNFIEGDEDLNRFPCIICKRVEESLDRHHLCSLTLNTVKGDFTDYHAICDTCCLSLYINRKDSKQKITCPMICCASDITSEVNELLQNNNLLPISNTNNSFKEEAKANNENYNVSKAITLPCPYCNTKYEKKQEEKITCAECKKTFLTCCGAKLTAILAHGDSYHRPSCQHANSKNPFKRFYMINCLVCKAMKFKNGKEEACPYPLDLNEKREVALEEKKFNEYYKAYYDTE